MAHELKRIHIPPGSEMAHLLGEVATQPLLLEIDGRTYRLEAEPAISAWPMPDPDVVHAGLRRTLGSWDDLDSEAEIAKVQAARDAGSRPATRP